MAFSSNCCVRYNPKDSLVILIWNNAIHQAQDNQPKPHKYKRCSICQHVAQILKQYLAQDYSFTLLRILNGVCVCAYWYWSAGGNVPRMWPGKAHFLGYGQTLWQTFATFCSKCQRALRVHKLRWGGMGRSRKMPFMQKQILEKKSFMPWFWARPLFFPFV